jgi:hypothetical protein
MNSGELKGGGGIFKTRYRLSDTVCMWRYLPFAQFLGGGVGVG